MGSSSPMTWRAIFGFSVILVALFFGFSLWQMSPPSIDIEEHLSQIRTLESRVQALESALKQNSDDHVSKEVQSLELRIDAIESERKHGTDGLSGVADSPGNAGGVQEGGLPDGGPDGADPSAGVSEGADASESGSTQETSPQGATDDSGEVQHLPAPSTGGVSVLHSLVLKSAIGVRDEVKECRKALELDDPAAASDPFGIPLWRKVLLEHKHTKFGDCRNGKGCYGFVSQGFQDLFLYSVLWRHLDRQGVYIDLASNDYKYISNTYFADHCLKFDGICIEANPMYYWGLKNRRRCVLEKTCVAEKTKEVTFNLQGVFGGIVGDMKDSKKKINGEQQKMTCQPLSKILARYSVRHVDYMNLDVEGVELQCLQGTDWDAVTIDVIGIEHNPNFEVMRGFLVEHGYTPTVTVAHDVFFVHKSATKVLDVLAAWRRDVCPKINEELKSINNGKLVVPQC